MVETKMNSFGNLGTAIKTKWNAVWTSQKSALLLNRWTRTIARTMATTKEFIKLSLLILFSLQL